MRTLRVLAILTKRQMIDNAAYLVPAAVFSLVFVPAVVMVILSDEFAAPSLHAVVVFIALPYRGAPLTKCTKSRGGEFRKEPLCACGLQIGTDRIAGPRDS